MDRREEVMVGMDKYKHCITCGKALWTPDGTKHFEGKPYCKDCWNVGNPNYKKSMKYNEPSHYHQHEIDTITFLQKGFKPEVFMGFAIGHVIKYAQRAEYKNGREDYVKMVDYAKRALDWYDKTKDLGE